MDILTEEELNEIEDNLRCDLDNEAIRQLLLLFNSHRLLLSANAELSFKNQKLIDAKKIYEKALGLIADTHYEGPVGALKWRDIANDALEAFDHE